MAGILLRPLLPVDETRYLSVAWEMHLHGDLLVPHKNGAIYTDKPPLLFWLIDLVWSVTGVSGFAARLVGPAFAVASLVLCGTLARTLWPDVAGVAARAITVLAGTTMFAVYGGLTMFDAMLTAATLGGLIALVRALRTGNLGWWVLYGAAIAFGVFAKGPVILLHLLPALVFSALWLPRAARPRPVDALRGGGLALAVALGLVALWLVPAILVGGPEYRDAVLWTQSAGRVSSTFGHSRPIWYLLAFLPLLLFPWIWSPTAWRAVRRLPWGDPGVRLCLVWSGAALVLFSLIGGKQLHYLLPELPAVALLLARGLSDGATPARWELAGLPVALVAAVAFAAGLGLVPLGDLDPLLRPRIALVAWSLAALALVWIGHRVGGYRGLAVLGLGLVLSLDLLIGTTRAARVFDSTGIARVLRASEPNGIAIFDSYSAEFNFTGRLTTPVAELGDETELAAWIGAHPNGTIVARADRSALDWPAREAIRFNDKVYAIWSVSDRPR